MGPLNAAAPVLVSAAPDAAVAAVGGSTFCLSNSSGDIDPLRAHGLFHRDARIVSRWRLLLDGRPAQPLAARSPEPFSALFIGQRPPAPGRADSTLLLVRERQVHDGMRERLVLRNLSNEATAAALALSVEADFADLFAVKEGRARPGPGLQGEVTSNGLVLSAEPDRAVRVAATGDPVVTPGQLAWTVLVPPRDTWETVVEVLPEPAPAHASPEPGRALENWRRTSTDLGADHPGLDRVLERSTDDLGSLRILDPSTGRAVVAAGAPWFMTLFGRDSLLTSWMALPLELGLAIDTLDTLAALQGRRVDPLTEEEPGRILHELRRGPDATEALGGTHYYGTVDASPLFVLLLAECWRWGASDDAVRRLLPAADAALRWATTYGDRRGDGFLSYRRATDRGLLHQGWKDSFDAVTDAAGRPAELPVSVCEAQAYLYGALLARADLADALEDGRGAASLRQQAAALRERFVARFWLPHGLPAQALAGPEGRRIDALASNAAHCLWTGLLDDVQAAQLVRHLAALDSGFGLRTLAPGMASFNPMCYHNGSVWPHDTALAVAGLARYTDVPGATELAQWLATGVVDAAAAFGGRLPELYCGFDRSEFDPPVAYPTSCSPQAWASAAPLLFVRALLRLDPDVPRRVLRTAPMLPEEWGTVELSGLELGPGTVDVRARGRQVQVSGLPRDWVLQTS
ncbi:MAG: glycogen debranching N-terminal domain-containing protein [Actinomycetes bacterium]